MLHLSLILELTLKQFKLVLSFDIAVFHVDSSKYSLKNYQLHVKFI